MSSRRYAVRAKPRAFKPMDVCRCRVSLTAMQLYHDCTDDLVFVVALDRILDPAADRRLTREAITARYEALAAWALETTEQERPAGSFDWPAILAVMAKARLHWDGRHYRFDHDAFSRALESVAHNPTENGR